MNIRAKSPFETFATSINQNYPTNSIYYTQFYDIYAGIYRELM